MSLSITNPYNNQPKTLKEKTLDYGQKGLILGTTAGVIESAVRKTWLNGDKPSDIFEKKVVENLEKTLPKDKYKEVKKINKFFYDITDPEVTVESLKNQLNDCDELKKAVPLKEGETQEQAIERIFSNPNKKELKQSLMDLQANTKLDKEVDKKAAKLLIKENFNKDKKILEKAATTSEEMFKVLKKSANSVRFHRGVIDTAIGAFIGGVGGMLIGASSKKTANK